MDKHRRRRGGTSLGVVNISHGEGLKLRRAGRTFLRLVFTSLGNSISKSAGTPVERAIAVLGTVRK